MKKNESHSSTCKSLKKPPHDSSSNQRTLRRPATSSSTNPSKCNTHLNNTNSFKTLSSNRASTTPRVPLFQSKSISSKRLKDPKDPKESTYLLSTLKSYIMKSSRELNQIQKEIPKFNARKIQDLKKGYKFNEDFDALASSFLSVFAEIDQELKKEMISLRMKIGEYLISYFSNSGKFIKILKNLTEILKNVELGTKALNDAVKMLEMVKRENLSMNYQDLHDLLLAIIKFFKNKKSSVKVLGEANMNLVSKRAPDRLLSTQSIINQSTELSFTEYCKPLSCSNKSVHCPSPFKQPLCKSTKDPRAAEYSRCSSHKSLSKRIVRLDDSKTSDCENSLYGKDPHSTERRKEWEEIRQVMFN